MFYDRKTELNYLEELYSEKKPKLVVLYGRRRVGKTELLKEFSKKHRGLYLLGRQESVFDQLKKVSYELAEYFGEDSLKLSPLTNWDAVFTFLKDRLKNKRIPIFFDEFPYLVQSHPALPSILQDYWDNHFSKTDAFLVLCGSSISMMEDLLGYKSPIYGRRTEQILLEPMDFFGACSFFSKSMSIKDKIEFYSVLGGTPAYLLEFDFNKSLEKNILEKILQKNKFLYNDVLFVLREELSEPRNYFSICRSVAKGNTKLGNIINDTGLDKGTAIKYLSVLIDLQIIERKVPITEPMQKSRKGTYHLKDNFFKFWFRFVFENTDYIEQGRQELLLKEKIRPNLADFVGRSFEKISMDWMKKQSQFRNYVFANWWNRTSEIDIVGIDKENKKAVFCEVKWKTLSGRDSKKIIEQLKSKACLLEWEQKNRKEIFVLIGKEIKEKELLQEKDILVFDLKDIEL